MQEPPNQHLCHKSLTLNNLYCILFGSWLFSAQKVQCHLVWDKYTTWLTFRDFQILFLSYFLALYLEIQYLRPPLQISCLTTHCPLNILSSLKCPCIHTHKFPCLEIIFFLLVVLNFIDPSRLNSSLQWSFPSIILPLMISILFELQLYLCSFFCIWS